ncbi:MAG TPA: AAA family ATPase [Bryobacteraceae bacterium]|jgi:superfamily I DNA/RNA helicase
MKLPTWDELILEQLNVMEHPLDQPLFVAGPPGSGKTVLAVRRAEMASDKGQPVALVTYNRMLRRLAAILTGGDTVANTMHRFAYLDYRNRTGTAPPGFLYRPSYDYDWDTMLATLDGHANAEANWDHVVVDEGQDLPEGFFRYLRRHAARVLTVFADEDQALDDRRTTLTQIRTGAELPNPILLKENHRNRPEIAAVAEHFHSGVLPAATPRRPVLGQRPRLIQRPSIVDTVELIATWLENRGGTIGVIVAKNSMAERVRQALTSRLSGRRVDCYTSGRNNEDQIQLLDDGVTILNKKSVKGQEFDSVFLLELEQFVPCATEVMKRGMYMMCSRARDHLFLVYGAAGLTAAAMKALPGADVLERG